MNILYRHVYKLGLFSLLVEHGSLRRAASAARLTESALSSHLATLETALGYPLIECHAPTPRLSGRSRSALKLTDQGNRLAIEIRPILRSLDALAPRTAGGSQPSRVRLGAYESVALTYLRRPVQQLACGAGDVRVNLRLARSSVLRTLLLEGEIDLAVLDTPASGPLESEPFGRSRLGLYVAANHAMTSRRAPAVARVGSLAFARGTTPEYFSRFLEFHRHYFATQHIELRTVIETESFEALRAMAAAGGIASVLPEHVARRNDGDLMEVPVPHRPEDCAGSHDLYLVSRREKRHIRKERTERIRFAETASARLHLT